MIHRLNPGEAITSAALLRRWLASTPRQLRGRWWVAVQGDEVVGWAMCFLDQPAGRDRVGWISVDVDPRRGQLRKVMFALAETHLRRRGASELRASATANQRGARAFLLARGFVWARTDRVWQLDPRKVNVRSFHSRLSAAHRAGFDVIPLRRAVRRARALYDLVVALNRDVPSDRPYRPPRYATWRRRVARDPTVDRDASVVVVRGREPVGLAWVHTNRQLGRGWHALTGTLRPYRHLGLARLAKLAVLRSAAAHGITQLTTANDSTNRDMLALNRHLGYRARPSTLFFVRRLRRRG